MQKPVVGFPVVFGLGLMLAALSCGDAEHGTIQLSEKPPELREVNRIEYTTAEATRQVTPEQAEAAVIALDPTGGPLTIAGDSELAAASEPGDVLMFGETSLSPEGALLKVVSKTVLEDGTVQLETEPAALAEAFDELHLRMVHLADYEDIDSYDTDIAGLALKQGAVLSLYAGYSEFGGKIFSITFPPVVIWDADFNSSTSTDQIKVGGTIDFGMALAFDVDIGVTLSLYHLKVGAILEHSSELTLDVMAPVEPQLGALQGKKTLTTLHLGTFWVGIVPLTLSIEVFLAWEVGLSYQLKTTVTSEIKFEVGVDYRNYGDSNDGFKPYATSEGSFDYTPIELNLEALAKVYAGARLSAKVFGAAGPYVQADAYIQLKAGVKDLLASSIPYWKLEWGLEAYVGFAGKMFGVKLFDWASPEILDWILGKDNPFPQLIAGEEPKVDVNCVPDCAGKLCGIELKCYQQCGTCLKGWACDDGKCHNLCGNGVCEEIAGESKYTCVADCPPICGDGECLMPTEYIGNCPEDCTPPCGDGVCNPADDESPCTCEEDCGECCGNGLCRAGEYCNTCPQDCGSCCPNDHCDEFETCTSCPQDCGVCCPNGECGPGESCTACPEDCGPCCGDGNCYAPHGENCKTCPIDCKVCCGNGKCDTALEESCSNCPQDCGLCCGDSTCADGETCAVCPKDCGTCCGDGKCEPNAGETACTCPADCTDDPNTCSACECGGSGGSCSCDPSCGTTGDCCPNVCQACGACVACGDGQCTGSESCKSCPADCGACCGNGTCEPQQNESSCSCPADCPDDPAACSPCQCGGSGGGCGCGPTCVIDGTCCSDACDACGSCPAVCGDGTCELTEGCGSCPDDCGVCCGNGKCDAGEDSCACPADCLDDPNACSPCQCGGSGGSCWCDESCVLTGSCCADACAACGACPAVCGDGACEGALGEDCGSCGQDCGECCGDDVCEAKRGENSCSCAADCPDDPTACSACECGGGGAGCSCLPGCAAEGTCCDNACSLCGSCPMVCGDGTCNGAETCASCPLDCGPCCGNGTCEVLHAEDSCSCSADCPDDPQACSTCECGTPSGGGCGCDADCVASGTCCANACSGCGFCAPTCGDGQCNGQESCQACPQDCGPCCGNGVCDPQYGEDSCSCPQECPDDPQSCSPCQCGASGGACSCAPGCVAAGNCCDNSCAGCGICPPACGDGTCNGSETTCSCLEDCPDDPDSCTLCECGGSGGSCGCSPACVDAGDCCQNACALCGTCAPECGDGVCNGQETSCSCPDDCPDDPYGCSPCQCGASGGSCGCSEACILAGDCCPDSCDACGFCPPTCGDGDCEADKGETSCSCAGDCGDPCAGLACGVDPVCGVSCGTCPAGQECDAGACAMKCGNDSCDPGETACTCPADCGSPCAAVECGTEPACGVDCGACAGGLICQGGACVEWCGDTWCNGDETKCTCPEDCGDPCKVSSNKCGTEKTCGAFCGGCPAGEICITSGVCVEACGNGVCATGECPCTQDCSYCQGIQCGIAPGLCAVDCPGSCGAGKECRANHCAQWTSCGNGSCEPSQYETPCNCSKDCGTCNGCCQYGTDACILYSQMTKDGPLCGQAGIAGVPCTRCKAEDSLWGQWCTGGKCVSKCGDGTCSPWEAKCTCPQDCGVCDGCCYYQSGYTINEGVETNCRSNAQQGPLGCGTAGASCAVCEGDTPSCVEGACVAP